ncbi:hypothetical protein AABM34_12170 [Lysinibacillus fusiformis]
MTIDIEQYLNKTFPGLTLTPSLYQQWDIGIHVEFGAGFYQWKDNGTSKSSKVSLCIPSSFGHFQRNFFAFR